MSKQKNWSQWSGEPWFEGARAFYVCDSCSRSIKSGERVRMRVVVLGRHRGRPQGVLRLEHPTCPLTPEKDAADKAIYDRTLGKVEA